MLAIAEISKQCITVITSQVDGREFITPSFPILFETPPNTQDKYN